MHSQPDHEGFRVAIISRNEDDGDEGGGGGGGGGVGGGVGGHLNNYLILCKLLKTAEPEVEPWIIDCTRSRI